MDFYNFGRGGWGIAFLIKSQFFLAGGDFESSENGFVTPPPPPGFNTGVNCKYKLKPEARLNY